MMRIGDQVRVIGQDITGPIVEIYGNLAVIEDDYAETDDCRLEFHISKLENV